MRVTAADAGGSTFDQTDQQRVRRGPERRRGGTGSCVALRPRTAVRCSRRPTCGSSRPGRHPGGLLGGAGRPVPLPVPVAARRGASTGPAPTARSAGATDPEADARATGRPTSSRRTSWTPRAAPARPSRSWTRSATRGSSPTWRRSARRTGCRRAPRANGCLQQGQPERRHQAARPDDPGWGVETSLDVQAVSSACPKLPHPAGGGRRLQLSTDLGQRRERRRVKLGADVVSNSYGTDEFTGVQDLGDRYYTHPGVAIVASTGDFGFTAAQFPAVLSTTIAVGGTTLKQAGRQLDRVGVGRRRQRLLGLDRQAVLAARHPLPDAHRQRRLGGRRPRHRVGGLRHLWSGGRQRLGRGRRHQRGSRHSSPG